MTYAEAVHRHASGCCPVCGTRPKVHLEEYYGMPHSRLAYKEQTTQLDTEPKVPWFYEITCQSCGVVYRVKVGEEDS